MSGEVDTLRANNSVADGVVGPVITQQPVDVTAKPVVKAQPQPTAIVKPKTEHAF